jgi:hypothetical protein
MDDRLIFRYLRHRAHAGLRGLRLAMTGPYGLGMGAGRPGLQVNDGVTQDGSPAHAVVDVG